MPSMDSETKSGAQELSVKWGKVTKSQLKKNIFLAPGLLLFFMMLFVPTAYKEIKIVLLGLTIGIILIGILKTKRTNLAPQTLMWVITWACSGLLFMTIGAFNSNPGALRVGSVYVLWPFLYLLFMMGASRLEVINKLFKVLVISSIFIGLYALSYILYSYGWLPGTFYINLDLNQSIGFYTGLIAYSMSNTSTLLFLIPFLMSLIMISNKLPGIRVGKFTIIFGLIMGLLLTILSGRRILQLLVLGTPILIFFYQGFVKKIDRKKFKKVAKNTLIALCLCVVVMYVFLNQVYGINIQTIMADMKDGFNFSSDASGMLRSGQFFALLEGWSQSPFFGVGHGASAPNFIRSIEQPWAYELSYVAYLYHTGIVGFLIYAAQLLWIIIMGIKIIKSKSILRYYMLPVLVGTTCFLVANATNPYLAKYDYMWVLFLPLTIINTWLINRNTNKEARDELYE